MGRIPERVVKALTSKKGRKALWNLEFGISGIKYQVCGLGKDALKLKIPAPTPKQDAFSFINWSNVGPEEEKIIEFLFNLV